MGETREIPYPDVDIAAVRRYVSARANESSGRRLAAEIGLRHSTFFKFLHGTEPYARNRILLCEWYLREYLVHPVPQPLSVAMQPPPENPEAHLDALLAELREDARLEARMRITTSIAQAYRRMGLPNPAWLYRTR